VVCHEVVVELSDVGGLLPHLVVEHLVGEAELSELVGGVVHEETVPASLASLHDECATVAEVVEALELAHGPLVPPHEEDAEREAVGDDDDVHVLAALAGGRLEPADVDVGAQRLAEAGDAVVDVGGGLAVGEAVEETAVAEAGLLLDAHLVAVLEVAEVLLPEARILPDAGDAARVLEGAADAAQRLQRAAVRGDVEVDLPVVGRLVGVGGEEVPEAAAAVLGVLPAFGGEADARVGHARVRRLVHVALALAVPHQHDPARPRRRRRNQCSVAATLQPLVLAGGGGVLREQQLVLLRAVAAERDAERVLAAPGSNPSSWAPRVDEGR
jgi:hypothetical protein